MKNKNLIISSISSFVGGVILTLILIRGMAPGLMLIEDESLYGFDESVTKFVESTKAHGWAIPATHDLQKSMAKFNKSPIKSVKVFELCHPDHAHRVLSENDERIVSTMMPCRVAIYEKDDGKTYFSRMNSSLMASMMGGIISEVMDDAFTENEEICKVLQSN